MAKIILSATMVRYPLGGMNQWILAWLVGLTRLGHEVTLVERSSWPDACYDVARGIMTDDCAYGVRVVQGLLSRYGLEGNWCYVDEQRVYHGLGRRQVAERFASADVFLDLEWGEWTEESRDVPLRIFYDGDPGWFQFSLMDQLDRGQALPEYHHYFTSGAFVGHPGCAIPTAGIEWRHMIAPVLMEGPQRTGSDPGFAFTTVMNWHSNKAVEYRGESYGQKDVEFLKFLELPTRVDQPLEVAVSGPGVPREMLSDHGWRIRDADAVAASLDGYRNYIAASRGEFSVVKNAFAKTRGGWFGERPGYYLYGGRPAVVQDTGFSQFLPCGEGLFTFTTLDEAAHAIASINADYERHSQAARAIAHEYLDATKVLARMLKTVGAA
jgi:hypothetical protein